MLDRTLDQLTISQPCSEDWESMAGNDQVRFCQHCNLHVNDLSQMTRREALRFVTESRGRLCVRYVRLPDGRIATSDLPAKLHLIGRRASRIAAGAFTAALSLSTVQAQGGASLSSGRSDRTNELINIERQCQLLIDEFSGSLSGTIKTTAGALISEVTIVLANRETGDERTTKTSSLGRYEFQLVPDGDYLLWARKHGFRTASEQIHINANSRLRADFELVERSRIGVMGASAFSLRIGDDPLLMAIEANDVEKVRALAYDDSNLNSPGRSHDVPILFEAVQRGNCEIVGILLAAGAGINVRSTYGQTGLMALTDKTTVPLVRDLLGAGARVNARDDSGNDALMLAAGSSAAAVLQELIAAGARVDATNQSGKTALFFAAQGDNPEAVILLMNSGALVNARNEDDETPLLAMAAYGKFESFKVLIERGANVQVADIDGLTVLMNAAINEDPRLVKLLLEAGADVNAKDARHYTALIYAAEAGRDGALALLAQAGANLDARDEEGQTALLKAATYGQLESVRLLLKTGADVTVTDKEGNTALSLARARENAEVVELLKLHGARE